ncbi:cation-translocating P-type ATPase C-terminal domain-containing protein [Rhodovulum sp. 12E13]|uniref:cation transporting ATPase C-terminal domain-containing protein n=1 Tax=Rhodovulum sp. 12E13 TaxID=2203891 RepID=UPI001313F17D|nr:cation-translocating P-type ATPase C-terminal domain-containing protein [Rhodovulum sp. 12E13]
MAELVLFTLSVIFDTALPLTPVQLLWLNLVTNGIQDIALSFEKGEPGVLKRRPRDPDERIFNRLMIEEVLVSGVYMGLVAFAVFHFLTAEMNFDTFEARNHLLLLMVLFENVHAFNVRSETRSAFRIPLGNNWLLVGAVIASQGAHILSMFVPGWRSVLEVEPVAFTTWAILLAITLTKFAIVEGYKAFRARKLAEETQRQPSYRAKKGDGSSPVIADHAKTADYAERAEHAEYAKTAERAERIVSDQAPSDRKDKENTS